MVLLSEITVQRILYVYVGQTSKLYPYTTNKNICPTKHQPIKVQNPLYFDEQDVEDFFPGLMFE